MWLINKKQSWRETSGFLHGFIDWHSHILPGVDDGVQTKEEALEILAKYDELGIKEVWLTPHIMEDIPNATQHLKERFIELQAAYKGNVILHLASENMIDSLFGERLENNDLLPIGESGSYLLVETSYFNPPMGLYDIIQRIKTKGFFPILAHPERYVYMGKKEYMHLKTSGVKFQLNLPSLIGMYGETVKKKAKQLLTHGYYDCVGTDLHRRSFLDEILQRNIHKIIVPLNKMIAEL